MTSSGAAIVIKTLKDNGVTDIFGYPGGSVLDIYDEIYKARREIRHVTASHEQGACHAADAYARATGKTGVVIATSGPGATNLVTGIATAYLDSTPLVAITGNVSVALMGKDSFQEVDIAGITMPITKHNYIVKNVEELEDTINEAFVIASSGRPGPVLIDIPKNVQQARYEYKGARKGARVKDTADLGGIGEAVTLIETSRRPFVYAGGGVVTADACGELSLFAEKIDSPVATSMMGLTAIPHAHPNNMGMCGMHGSYAANRCLAESDLLIAVGTRFSDRATGDKSDFYRNKKIIHIDIDPAEICKNIDADISLLGDMKDILSSLTAAVRKKENGEWNEEIGVFKADKRNNMDMAGDLTPQQVIEEVNRRMREGETVATDVGQHQMWVTQYYRFERPRTLMTSGGLGTMGFGMGAAVGASVATGKRCVLFTSDGSFHMNMNEFATAVSERLPIVVVLLNNNALGMVRQWQKLFYGGRYSNTSLARRTDYVKLAEAMGGRGYRAQRYEELAETLDKAFACKTPVIVECVIDSDERVLPMIPSGGNIDKIIVRD